MTPHVLGPNALPRLDPAEVKRSPVLAMLSTLANLDDPTCGALLWVLGSRGIEVSADAARRIEEERDDARFEMWIRRAATATTIDDVFSDESSRG